MKLFFALLVGIAVGAAGLVMLMTGGRGKDA